MIHAVLTIDDLPSKNTRAIVDYLNSKDIQALMFVVGGWFPGSRENAVYALQHGMILGNHSFTHPFFSELSREECIEEIEKNEEFLDKLYEDAGVERRFRPFRFPYGDKGGKNKEFLQEYLKDRHFNKVTDTSFDFPFWKDMGLDKDIDTFWTFDFGEYNIRKGSGFTEEDVFKRVEDPDPEDGVNVLEDGRHHLLLLHAHDETEELVPEYYKHFIDYLLDKGYVFDRPEFFDA